MIREGDGSPFAAVQSGDVPDHVAGLVTSPEIPALEPAVEYQLSPNETTFAVQANGPGLIVLAEAYYADDFIALLNGKPVPYFRVNHAFKGIHVERSGLHRVSFRYWPKHLTLGLWLSGAGLVLAMIAVLRTVSRASD